MTDSSHYQTETRSLAETDQLATQIGQGLQLPLVLALTGTLGAGKTRLVRALADSFGAEPDSVTSPTFTLWQTYSTQPVIHHLDAYRIQSLEEFWELGIEEQFDGNDLIVIEWANKFPEALPDETLWIEVKVVSDNVRGWTFNPVGENARATLEAIVNSRRSH